AREGAHDAPHPVEALGVPELLALREEELVAEADAEERPPAVERAAERPAEPGRVDVLHRVAERPVARQHTGLGLVDDPGVGGHARGNADARERLLDAPQVAPAVVDDRDHSTGYGRPRGGGSGRAPGAPPRRATLQAPLGRGQEAL